MPYMAWSSLLNSPTAVAAGSPNGGAGSSSALNDISPLPQFTLPANFLQAGSALRFKAFGTFSNTSTPTLLVGVYYGGSAGVALAPSGAITTTTTVTNVPWRLEVDTIIRTTGSTGTAISSGFLKLGSAVTTYVDEIPIPPTAMATVTIDTTLAKTLTIAAQWGTANAANLITLHGHTIESLGV